MEAAASSTLWGQTHEIYNTYLSSIGAPLERTNPAKETHMSLIGGFHGRLLIPQNYQKWLQVYSTELARNQHSLFLAERRTPIFRMHFDLDFTQPSEVCLDDLVKMARASVDVFRKFYPDVSSDDEQWQTVILCAPSKPIMKQEERMVKSGCHLIWPNLFVDQAIALQLRLNVVEFFQREWPKRTGLSNDYDDVVDKSVLTSNGLRMYGSDKGIICNKCRRNQQKCKTCDVCLGRGVLVENRAYTLSAILDPSGELDTERYNLWERDLFTCVRNSSTRSSHTSPTPGYKVPSHAVSDVGVKRARKTSAGGSAAAKKTSIDPTSPVFHQIQSHITCMNPAWSSLQIRDVARDNGRYICHVQGPGSLYCTNAKRAHTSSSIFFTITPEGVQQRCFSHKSVGRVKCRTFAGPMKTISRWLHEALFGKMARDGLPNPYTDHKENMECMSRYKTELSAIAKRLGYTSAVDMSHHPDYPGLTHAHVKCFRSYCQADGGKLLCMFTKEIQQRCVFILGDPLEVYKTLCAENGPMKKSRSRHK